MTKDINVLEIKSDEIAQVTPCQNSHTQHFLKTNIAFLSNSRHMLSLHLFHPCKYQLPFLLSLEFLSPFELRQLGCRWHQLEFFCSHPQNDQWDMKLEDHQAV